MISRPSYIEQLRPFIDKPQIKIITGIRRSGKSTVLHLLKDELLERVIKYTFDNLGNTFSGKM